MKTTRRAFLRSTAATGAIVAMPSILSARNVNSQLRAAAIGFHSRGADLIEGLRVQPGVKIVALCDVDREVLGRKAREFSARGETVEAYTDARRVFDRSDIDLIITATPNHWHSLMGIWACQSGKDAYVEKPISHDVNEGGKLVEAARKYGRIVQCGTQCRSSSGIAEGVAFMRSGALGKIVVSRGFCYKPRKSIGKAEHPTVPASVDYDLWCGPSKAEPLHRSQLHYDWHWVYETGNGDLGNQGVHQVDLCRMAIGASGMPRRALSFGGRLGYQDDGDTANTQVVYIDYPEAPIVFEVRGLPKDKATQGGDWAAGMDAFRNVRVGCVIECEGGSLVIPDYTSAIAYDKDGKELKRWNKGEDHMANFIAAVRSRKVEDLKADCQEGHVSAALCHFGNASYRRAPQDQAAAEAALRTNAILSEALDRTRSHAKANEVDLTATPFRIGSVLEIDASGKVTNDAEANALLKREGRSAFVIPEKV